jgi:hypothetical protein
MSELEAAGAAATAGLVAGAIERKGGAPVEPPGPCLNCGAQRVGAYCHACGQPGHISRRLSDVVLDFLNAFLNFDTKTWRTLPLLVVRPGTMTHAYIHGARARYVSPLAMFLFSIFVMFFVIQVVVESGETPTPDGPVAQRVLDVPSAEARVREAQAARDRAAADFEKASVEAAAARASGKPGTEGVATGIITGPQVQARQTEEALQAAKSRLLLAQSVARAAPQKESAVNINVEGRPITAASEDGRTWQDRLRENAESGEFKTNTGWPLLDRALKHAALNPDLALYKLQDTASQYTFLLVPISLPFIALLFVWKRGVTLFDHVVFSLYSLSFMSLLFITLGLASRLGDWAEPAIVTAALTVPPVHMFFHLGGAYGLGWWSALWRTVLLLFFIFFVCVIFAISIVLLGVLS